MASLIKKEEATVIEQIVRYSNIIILLKLLKRRLEKTRLQADDTGVVLHTKEYIQLILDETDMRIFQINHQIKKLLIPLFQGINFIGYNEDSRYWNFTESELAKGYLPLEDIAGNKYILFLSNYKDSKHDIKGGSLMPHNKVTNILSNQKNLVKKTINFYKEINNHPIIKKG